MSIKNRTIILHAFEGRTIARRLSSLLAGADTSRIPGDYASGKNPRFDNAGALREPAGVIVNGNPATGEELKDVAGSLAELMKLEAASPLIALVGPVDRTADGFEYRSIRVQPYVFASGGIIKEKASAYQPPAAPKADPSFPATPRRYKVKFDGFKAEPVPVEVKLPEPVATAPKSPWSGEDSRLPNPWVSVTVEKPVEITSAIRHMANPLEFAAGRQLENSILKASTLYPNCVVTIGSYARCFIIHRDDTARLAEARFAARNGRTLKSPRDLATAEIRKADTEAKNFKGVTPEHNAGGKTAIERARRYHFEGGQILELIGATRAATTGTWHRGWVDGKLTIVDPAKVNHVLIVGLSKLGGPVVEEARKVVFADGSQLNLRQVTHLDVTDPAVWVIQHAEGTSRVNVGKVLHVTVS